MLNLYKAFSAIKNEKEFFNFLNDICTPTEIREISERWNIAQMLNRKELSQQAIAKKLNCGIATITRVSRFLKEEKFGGYREILARLYPASAKKSS
jgi:TrpR-related protein YerC/YecD